MNTNEQIKKIVQESYSKVANRSKLQNQASCCGSTCGCKSDTAIFNDDYSNISGYVPDADLGLGCGIPTEFAGIKSGDSVLDLGSGAGNDCFIARSIVGADGMVTGIDFTDAMIHRAQTNATNLNFSNVVFVKGDIEEMPIPDNQYNVVISNCVLNLVPNKQKAFSEIRRVLKANGHFCVSDVVLRGLLPKKLMQDAEMYAGCVSGAIQIEDYIGIIYNEGFRNVEIKKEKIISIPDSILLKYLTNDELERFHASGAGISSITVSGTK